MANEITRHQSGRDREREMVPLRALMDRMMENAFMPLSSWQDARSGFSGGITLDVEEDENAYYVKSQLPGIKPEDVQINVHNGVLAISGETKREAKDGRRPVHQEIHYGRFERQVALPAEVDAEKAEADFTDGCLEITLPKSERSRPRTIQIKSSERKETGSRS